MVITPYTFADDDTGRFERDCAQMVVRLDTFLTRNYGPRCDEYEPDCCVCKAWHLRDGFKAHACD